MLSFLAIGFSFASLSNQKNEQKLAISQGTTGSGENVWTNVR